MDDDRLIQALAHANYKATLAQQRQNLELRYTNARLYAHNGGIFTVSPTLLAMVDLLLRHGYLEAVLVDDKLVPIKISDLAGFFETIMAIYAEVTNEYLMGWEKFRKARSVEAAIQ